MEISSPSTCSVSIAFPICIVGLPFSSSEINRVPFPSGNVKENCKKYYRAGIKRLSGAIFPVRENKQEKTPKISCYFLLDNNWHICYSVSLAAAGDFFGEIIERNLGDEENNFDNAVDGGVMHNKRVYGAG